MKYGYTRCDLRDLEKSQNDRLRLPSWFFEEGIDHQVIADLNYRCEDPAKRFHFVHRGDELYLPCLRALARDSHTAIRAMVWLQERGVRIWSAEAGLISGELIKSLATVHGGLLNG